MLSTEPCQQNCCCVQTAAQDSTHAEHRNLVTKLEALEQRQAAAAQLASEAAHRHSLQAKQVELSVEDHQRRMQSALSKAELRSREAAEQIADSTVAEAQSALQVGSRPVPKVDSCNRLQIDVQPSACNVLYGWSLCGSAGTNQV